MGSHTIKYTDAEALAAAVAGAASTATASKLVIRDAEGQAKLAAPAEAGDASIKGTRVTTAELPAMTDEYYWVGTGANVEERAVPASASTGTYTGDDGDNRAIPHGLGVAPKIVFIAQLTDATGYATDSGYIVPSWQVAFIGYRFAVTAMNATNFYVIDSPANFNRSGKSYRWVALS